MIRCSLCHSFRENGRTHIIQTEGAGHLPVCQSCLKRCARVALDLVLHRMMADPGPTSQG